MEGTIDTERKVRMKELHKSKARDVKRSTRRDKINFYHRKAEEAEEAVRRGNLKNSIGLIMN